LVSFNALYHTSYNIDLFNFPLDFFAYGKLLLEFQEITIKFLPLSWVAWVHCHCQVSIAQLSFTRLKKKGSEEHCFDSILLKYWISTNKLVFRQV